MKEMLSVTEYANLTGRDPGNIRRMLAAGRLEGRDRKSTRLNSSHAR